MMIQAYISSMKPITHKGITLWEGEYLGEKAYFKRVMEKDGKPTIIGYKAKGSFKKFCDEQIKQEYS
jgi:hypothetical protein